MYSNRTTCLRHLGPIGLFVNSALGLWFCLPGSAAAQVDVPKTARPTVRADDPKARALFNQVQKAYQALSSYSDEGHFEIAMTIGGRPTKQSSPLKLTFVRPDKLDFDAGTVRVTSDGKTLSTAALPFKRYSTEPAPGKIGLEMFQEGPLGAVVFGGPARAPMFVLLSMLTSPDPAASIAQLGGSFQLAPSPVSHDPKSKSHASPQAPALVIDLENSPDILLTIDPATKLLSSIELKIEPELLAQSAPAGQKLSVAQFGWSSGRVSTQVAPDRSFVFDPPKGFAKVEKVLAQRDEHAGNEKLGKPAPEFTLTVLDGPGKTKTITKAELAGKVLVLDFWATWCGPCLMELPEIQKLIEALASAKKDVLVVAVSQDSQPNEIEEVRKLVEKTLSEKNIKLTDSPVGLIALDPSNSIGQAFDIAGYPTLVILDAAGTIKSVHVGFDANSAEPLHQSLAREIDALLERKPLAAPKNTHNKAGEKGQERPKPRS